MASTLSLSDARRALEDAGLDSSTPGLRGEARHRALLGRLEEKRQADVRQGRKALYREDLTRLSLTDIRQHLAARGVETETPGFRGEARRDRLLSILRNLLPSRPKLQDDAGQDSADEDRLSVGELRVLPQQANLVVERRQAFAGERRAPDPGHADHAEAPAAGSLSVRRRPSLEDEETDDASFAKSYELLSAISDTFNIPRSPPRRKDQPHALPNLSSESRPRVAKSNQRSQASDSGAGVCTPAKAVGCSTSDSAPLSEVALADVSVVRERDTCDVLGGTTASASSPELAVRREPPDAAHGSMVAAGSGWTTDSKSKGSNQAMEKDDKGVVQRSYSGLKDELRSVKNQIRQINTRRAEATAARTRGENKDAGLLEAEKSVAIVESEISHFQSRLRQSGGAAQVTCQSALVNSAAEMTLAELLVKLDKLRLQRRAERDDERARVYREEAEHVDYGIARERALKQRLKDLEKDLVAEKARQRRERSMSSTKSSIGGYSGLPLNRIGSASDLSVMSAVSRDAKWTPPPAVLSPSADAARVARKQGTLAAALSSRHGSSRDSELPTTVEKADPANQRESSSLPRLLDEAMQKQRQFPEDNREGAVVPPADALPEGVVVWDAQLRERVGRPGEERNAANRPASVTPSGAWMTKAKIHVEGSGLHDLSTGTTDEDAKDSVDLFASALVPIAAGQENEASTTLLVRNPENENSDGWEKSDIKENPPEVVFGEISPLVLARRGMSLIQQGQTEQGNSLLDRAIDNARSPEISQDDLAEVLSRVALFHQKTSRNFWKAEEMFEEALKVLPDHLPTLINYAAFRRKIKADVEGAEVLYVKALAIDAENSQALAGYAHLISEVHENQSLAEMFFQRAVRADPRNPQILANYARCMRKQSKNNEAEALYRAALSIDNTCASAVCNYANFLVRVRRNPLAAKELYEKGLRSNPNHPQLKRNYVLLAKEESGLRGGSNAKGVPRGRGSRTRKRRTQKMLVGGSQDVHRMPLLAGAGAHHVSGVTPSRGLQRSPIPEAEDPRMEELSGGDSNSPKSRDGKTRGYEYEKQNVATG